MAKTVAVPVVVKRNPPAPAAPAGPPETAHRQAIFSEMTPATQKLTLKIAKTEAQVARNAVLPRYDVGTDLVEAVTHPEKFGPESVRQIAAYFGKDVRPEANPYLDLVRIAKAWSREEVAAMVERTTAAGGHIGITQLQMLANVSGARDRKRLTERTFVDNLSVRQLSDEIGGSADRLGRTRAPGAGRPAARPSSVAAGVSQIASVTATMNRRFDQVWDELVERLGDAGPDDVDEAVLARAEAAVEALTILHGHVEQTTDNLVAALEILRGEVHKDTAAAARAIKQENLARKAAGPDKIDKPAAAPARKNGGKVPAAPPAPAALAESKATVEVVEVVEVDRSAAGPDAFEDFDAGGEPAAAAPITVPAGAAGGEEDNFDE